MGSTCSKSRTREPNERTYGNIRTLGEGEKEQELRLANKLWNFLNLKGFGRGTWCPEDTVYLLYISGGMRVQADIEYDQLTDHTVL